MIKRLILRIVFAFFYFAGLTGIITTLFLIDLPKRFEILNILPIPVFLASIVFIIIGITGLRYANKSKQKTLQHLGVILLIPGIISFFVGVFGYNSLFIILKKTNLDIKIIEEILEAFLNKTVFNVWVLTIFYILIGLIFYWFSRKSE